MHTKTGGSPGQSMTDINMFEKEGQRFGVWEVWQTLRQPLPTLTIRLLCLGTSDISTFWKGVGVVTGAFQATNYMG